jgi:hypothetical protein
MTIYDLLVKLTICENIVRLNHSSMNLMFVRQSLLFGSNLNRVVDMFALFVSFSSGRLKALLISQLLMGLHHFTEQQWPLLFFGRHVRILLVPFTSYQTDYASVRWRAGLGGKGDYQ